MLDIGVDESSVKLDEVGERTLGVLGAVGRNKLLGISIPYEYLDLGIPNKSSRISPVPFKFWRIVALCMTWTEASTANEDPAVEIGEMGDLDSIGKMTSAIIGGEKFCAGDFQKYDPLNILADEIITETSATMTVTWTPGVKFNVWQTTPFVMFVCEAAVAGMTSGRITPCIIIEVKTRGKW